MKTIVSGFKILDLGLLAKRHIENLVLIISGLVFAVAIYTVTNDSLWLYFLGPITEDLKPIASIGSKTGTSVKKTAADSLWLPIVKNQIVFEGDAIFTQKDSLVEVVISEDSKVFVEPDSLVRIKFFDGRPMLKISQGTVKVQVSGDQVFMVKKGATMEKVLIQKGTYFIKNDDSPGIQITTYDQRTNLSQGKRKNNSVKAKMAKSAAEDSGDDGPDLATEAESESGSAADEAPEPTSQTAEYDLPTPQNGTLFLIKKKRPIVIGSKPICEDRCQFKLFFNDRNIESKDLVKNQSSIYILPSENVQYGSYTWHFESDHWRFEGNFKVEAFTEEALSNALKTELPVEIQF